MPELNLDPGYFSHIKTLRLVARLGAGAELLPIKLWCHCATHHADDARLDGYQVDEIEAIIGWTGQCGKAVAAMLEVGFLQCSGDAYAVTNWESRQGHLKAARVRARAAAHARWNKIARPAKPAKSRQGEPCPGIADALPKDTSGNPPSVLTGLTIPTNPPYPPEGGGGGKSRAADPGTPDTESRIPPPDSAPLSPAAAEVARTLQRLRVGPAKAAQLAGMPHVDAELVERADAQTRAGRLGPGLLVRAVEDLAARAVDLAAAEKRRQAAIDADTQRRRLERERHVPMTAEAKAAIAAKTGVKTRLAAVGAVAAGVHHGDAEGAA